MDETERDILAYSLAKHYLLSLGTVGLTPKVLEKYLRFAQKQARPDTLPLIYQRLLVSAQNTGMKPRVVGQAIGGIENLTVVLYGFDPRAVLEEYHSWQQVLSEIRRRLDPRGQVRETVRGIWPQYCMTILSAAQFLVQFETASEFYQWADFFDGDDRARAALPMLLHHEIRGLGFALACDFLKEIGYINFAKPDVHVRDIFTGLGLCPTGASDYQLFKAEVRLARHAAVTPYNADKLFWFIGSGYFYDDRETIGDKGRIGSNKAQFITYARDKLA